MKLLPIDCEEKELCVLCCIGLVVYDYMPLEAKVLYDTIADEEKEEIKKLLK